MRSLFIKSLHGLALLGAAAAASGAIQAQAQIEDGAARCASLAQADWSTIPDAPTQIVNAARIERTDSLPAHCRVRGYVRPNVNFEIQLPDDWNGKFMMSGCGGSCGQVLPLRCGPHVARGYACIVHDMGHSGAMTDSLWALNNLQAEVDFGYRATHVTAVIGKAIAERHYSTPPRYSYYEGCSTGGRQGLVAAQRFPADFDGIIAGAPIIDFSGNLMSQAWSLLQSVDGKGEAIFTADELQRVQRQVMERCDAADGLEDGVLQNPPACKGFLESLACRRGASRDCLSREKIEILESIYRGPVNAKGEPLYTGGPAPGTEADWVSRWADPAGANGAVYRLIGDVFRYRLFAEDKGPQWQLREFDWERDPNRLGAQESLVSGMNPDLRKFARRGGKIILYQGWNDTSVVPANVIDYAETATRVLGEQQAAETMRLYMMPGMGHCARGTGPDAVDWVAALEAWVERGEAPNVLSAAKLKQPRSFESLPRFPLAAETIAYGRPLFPWPQNGQYVGPDDPAVPAQWRVAPAP
jgi:feruloyl esterase